MHVQSKQVVGLPVELEGLPKRTSKALFVGQVVTNMDTKLGTRHLTKDMQDLFLHKVNIIRDNISFKKGS